MFKKLIILAVGAFNLFTLSSIEAQVPSDYQEIILDLQVVDGTSGLQAVARDNTYFDLWSFRNFQDAYIDINGFTVVSDGTPITNAEFSFNVQYGQSFELVYDNVAYYFSLTELEISGVPFTILSESVYAFAVNGRTDLPDPHIITLSLPDSDVVSEPEISGGFLELLSGYGMFNPTGLLILFAVTLMIVNVSLAFLKVPSMVYIATNLAIGSGFIFFNLIPIWSGFIFLSVMALFLVLSFRGSKL